MAHTLMVLVTMGSVFKYKTSLTFDGEMTDNGEILDLHV